jgi:cell division protein FtsW (lipid II flippase)
LVIPETDILKVSFLLLLLLLLLLSLAKLLPIAAAKEFEDQNSAMRWIPLGKIMMMARQLLH